MFDENISDIEAMYTGRLRLLAHDVDCTNRWKLSSVFSNTQEIASFNCKEYGLDWIRLRDCYDACYVLTRMKVKLFFYPGSSDVIRVNTWPGAKPRMIWTRYFSFETEDRQQKIGEAVSQWVLINRTTRALMKPTDCHAVTPDTSHIPIPFTLDRGDFDFTPDRTLSRRVTYSDLDYNGHVNNARYVEWIMDLFPLEVFYQSHVAEFDIKYEQEIRYGQRVMLAFRWDQEQRRFFARGYSEEEGVTFFKAMGTMRENGEEI